MRRSLAIALVVAATASTARAEVFVGEVIAADGAWEGDAIVTTATVRTPTGDVVVHQLGGWADGYGMLVMDGDRPLEAGLRVEVLARKDATRWIADQVSELGAGRVPFVRTTTKRSRTPLYWAASCVQIGYAEEGTAAIAGDDERAVIEQSFATWNDGVAACSHQNLASLGPIDREVSGRDFVTVIKFRDGPFCRPAVDGKAAFCHSDTAYAVTTVVFVDEPDDPRDGEIVDADIEMNGHDFAISVNGVTLSTQTCLADLASTLTHELGHVLGLEHTCRTGTDGPRVDHNGVAVPRCDDTTDPVIRDATMFPYQNCGETDKATLTADDTLSLCTIYPVADGPGACKPPDPLDPGCCSGALGRPGLAIGLATLALLIRRRRRATSVG